MIDLRKDHQCRIELYKHLKDHQILYGEVNPSLLIAISDFLRGWDAIQDLPAIKPDKRINNVEEPYCSFEISKLLKEKGFKVPTFKLFSSDGVEKDCAGNSNLFDNNPPSGWVSRPTHAVAIEWIRLNYAIWIRSESRMMGRGEIKWVWFAIDIATNTGHSSDGYFNSPQEAIESALLSTLRKNDE